jgi:hypothetical protein
MYYTVGKKVYCSEKKMDMLIFLKRLLNMFKRLLNLLDNRKVSTRVFPESLPH